MTVERYGKRTRKAQRVHKSKGHSLIYPLVVALTAIALLVVLGVTGQLVWSPALTFLAVGCISAEWLVIQLPQGNSLTTSIIFVLLALVFRFDQTSLWAQAVGAMQIVTIGALIGYAVARQPPLAHLALYAAHYVWAAFLAGLAFVAASGRLAPWLVSSFHLPAVAIYIVVYSLCSTLIVGPFNRRILEGSKLPTANLLYTVLLAPIALVVYYFFDSRELSVTSLFILALPLLGVLVTFRLYINIDTNYGEVNQLYQISQEFLAAMSQEETVQRVAGSIAEAMSGLIPQLDASLIYALNQESNEYVLANPEAQEHGPRNIIPGNGLLGRIIFESTGVILNDITKQDALSPEEQTWSPKTAVLAHPLFAERNQVGLLVLVRYGKRFTAEEFRLVGIVAGQAGSTLHNAQMYERSMQMADRDRQLDVLNQAAFKERAERLMIRARADNQVVALLYPDIDDFRVVNNTYGHPTGDRVLAGVAGLMKQEVGGTGLIGRSGGEEFFILLANTTEQRAVDTANNIRQRIQDHVFVSLDQREVKATISTGVALFPRDAGDIESLIKQADRAAYLAKRMGKNRVCLYEDRKELLDQAEQETQPVKAQAHE